MKKAKKIDGEFTLPDPIIQDIQSCLTTKEAVRTTVLSKAWYKAWSTHPIIELDYRRFLRNGNAEEPDAQTPDPFAVYARKTMKRYEDLNIKIETFNLYMESSERDQSPLAGELIARAVKLGAKYIDIGFKYTCGKKHFILPHEVLGSENLVRLFATGCTIELDPGEKINCRRLRFLGLARLYVQCDVIWDIINRCPLERLLLSECKFLYTSNFHTNKTRQLDLGRYGFGANMNADKSLTLLVFSHLTCLLLRYVKIDPSFVQTLSSKFPCLKELALSYCLGPKKIHICSPSLESIHIEQRIMLRARIIVPNLRRFYLSSVQIPTLTFETASGECESRVYAGCAKFLNNSWFRHFKKFLKVMSVSKLNIILYLTPCWLDSFDCAVGLKSRPMVECVTINPPAFESLAFWNGLFWSCRPRFISTSCSSEGDMGALDAACKRLVNLDDNPYTVNKSMFGQSDLEKVNLEIFDITAGEWKLSTSNVAVDATAGPETKKHFRFRLEWNN